MSEQPTDTFKSDLHVCYEILLYLASRMAKLKPGEVFEFMTSDPGAADEIVSWCDLRGYTLLLAELSSTDRWRFLIQK